MKDKIEFISEVEDTPEALFEKYFDETIMPAVEDENRIKDTYRSRFWGYLWSACFLLGANTLIIFFRYLMYHYPVSYEQIFLVVLLAICVVVFPIYQYYKLPKRDLFDIFLNYYGNWKHLENTEVKLVHSPVVPPHEAVSASHSIAGNYDDLQIEVRDTVYQSTVHFRKWKFKRVVSAGVMIYVKFNKKFKNKIYLFDKTGFYRKNKYSDLINVTKNILVPAANYFHIFTQDEDYAKDMLPSEFFERILDLKEIFKAKHLYIQMEEDYMRIYLEGAQLYFDNYSLWSKTANREKFVALNREMEQILAAVQLVQVMKEQI